MTGVLTIEVLFPEIANLHGDAANIDYHAQCRPDARVIRTGLGDRPAFAGLIAEDAGEAQGYLLYNELYDTDLAQRMLFVIDLYVRPAARGQGFGRALMAEAERLCRAAGGGALLWGVLHQNAAAMAFYEKLGARYVDDVRFMVMRLPASS